MLKTYAVLLSKKEKTQLIEKVRGAGFYVINLGGNCFETNADIQDIRLLRPGLIISEVNAITS